MKIDNLKVIYTGLILVSSLFTPIRAIAQVTSDNTLSTTVTSPDGQNFIINNGDRAGNNLFHSFQDFSIPNGGSVSFANAADIANILSRVTGGNISEIDGAIAANGNANLFLINPAGIIFGNGASLDIGGSFYASSASSLLFPDGVEFSASDLDSPPLLTINTPIGLGFKDNPGNIVNRSNFGLTETVLDELLGANLTILDAVGLRVNPSQNIALIGGNVILEDAGAITAPGGKVELGGLSQAGAIAIAQNGSLSFPQGIARGDVSLSGQARVKVAAGGGGSISISAKNFQISELSELYAGIAEDLGSPNAQAGNIEIDATESVRLVGSGGIGDNPFSLLFNDYDTAIRNVVGLRPNDEEPNLGRNPKANSSAVGNAGSIAITTDLLQVEDRASLSAKTYGLGNTGNVEVLANNVILNKGDLFNQVISGSGNAGNIEITTNKLSVIGSSQELGGDSSFILSELKTTGNIGDINITVFDEANLKGINLIESKIADGAEGKAGNITISTGSLNLTDGFIIQTKTLGRGNAGAITITAADTVSLNGGSTIQSIVDENREFNSAIGNAGNITITARELTLSNGSLLNNASFARGNAGNITINASDEVLLDNGFLNSSLNVLENAQFNAIGQAGNIKITAAEFNLLNYSVIETATSGRGDAGKVAIDTVGSATVDSSLIISQVRANGIGNGGEIEIVAGDSVNLSDRSLLLADSSENTRGNAGNIILKAKNDISIGDESIVLSQIRGIGDGGEIEIDAGDSISLSDRSLLLADSGANATGNAGDITLNADKGLSVDESLILSQINDRARGDAGKITFTANSIEIDNFSLVSTSAKRDTVGEAGKVDLSGDTIKISNGATVDSLTENKFAGGSIALEGKNLAIISGGKVVTSTIGSGDAGNINLNIGDRVYIDGNNAVSRPEDFSFTEQALLDLELATGLFANTSTAVRGSGGSITIGNERISQAVTLANNARISADSRGLGGGGSVSVRTDSLTLNNNSSISGATAAETGGNLAFTIAEILTLNNNSSISAKATGNADGGNIEIDAEFILATPDRNSDIVADAFEGNGGNINITTKGIFGIEERSALNPLTNDINASSAFSIDGTININTPNVDPTSGLVELSDVPIDVDAILAQDLCKLENDKLAGGSTFIVTGRGGLFPTSAEPLDNRDVVGWANRQDIEVSNNGLVGVRQRELKDTVFYPAIQQSQGWVTTADGSVWLVANAPKSNPLSLEIDHRNCQIKEKT